MLPWTLLSKVKGVDTVSQQGGGVGGGFLGRQGGLWARELLSHCCRAELVGSAAAAAAAATAAAAAHSHTQSKQSVFGYADVAR